MNTTFDDFDTETPEIKTACFLFCFFVSFFFFFSFFLSRD